MPAWQNLYLWILSRFQAEQTRLPRQRVSSGKTPTSRIFWEYFSLQQAPLELPKTLGKQLKVRFLSCPQDRSTFYFPLSWLLGFSHFWPIALAFLHVHARACLQVLRRLVRCLAPW